MKHRNALIKLNTHLQLPIFEARNELGHPKHKHPMIRKYSEGTTRNPLYMKDHGHYIACTPHFGGLAVMDFDYHPDWEQDWDGLDAGECQKLLREYVKEFAAIIPNWHGKVLFQHKSGSGRGLHVWFKRPYNPDSELNGRPRFAGGDFFVGKGYIIIYHPDKLWNAVQLKYGVIDPLTDSDVERIKAHRKIEKKKKASRKKPKAAEKSQGSFGIGKLPSAQDLAMKYKGGEDCSADVFHRIQGACSGYFTENLSDNPDFDWSPRNLSFQLMALPREVYQDEICRDMIGMSLCHVSITDIRLLELYQSLPCVDAAYAKEKWPDWQRIAIEYEKPVNFGKICSLVRMLNRCPKRIELEMSLDDFFSKLVANPDGEISCSDLYMMSGIDSIEQREFTKYFISNWQGRLNARYGKIQTKNKKYVNGFKGISLK